jgi:hypothetical protein
VKLTNITCQLTHSSQNSRATEKLLKETLTALSLK